MNRRLQSNFIIAEVAVVPKIVNGTGSRYVQLRAFARWNTFPFTFKSVKVANGASHWRLIQSRWRLIQSHSMLSYDRPSC